MEKLNTFDCPICLQTLLQPLTLVCGHTFCKPCIRNKHFYQHYTSCPVCRAPLHLSVYHFKVNVLLEQLIKTQCSNEQYLQRLNNYQLRSVQRNRSWILMAMRLVMLYSQKCWGIIQKMLPLYLIIMGILMYASFRQNLRLRFQNEIYKKAGLEKLSEELSKMMSMLKMNHSENKDLDIQNLVLSKIVKYLFTNCVRF